mmetsp:Transcript_13115/g.24912  ORF Transcript_13115/g.24912 Transcript_13115/m.24912 type:complete len:227 (-) Transcript_13115:218-898(-)
MDKKRTSCAELITLISTAILSPAGRDTTVLYHSLRTHSMVALSKSSGRASRISKRPTFGSPSSSSPKSSWYSSSSLSSPSPPPPLNILFPMSPPPPASSVFGWLILTSCVKLSLDFCIVAPPLPLSWAMHVVGTLRSSGNEDVPSCPPFSCVPSSSKRAPPLPPPVACVTHVRLSCPSLSLSLLLLLLQASLCSRRLVVRDEDADAEENRELSLLLNEELVAAEEL